MSKKIPKIITIRVICRLRFILQILEFVLNNSHELNFKFIAEKQHKFLSFLEFE